MTTGQGRKKAVLLGMMTKIPVAGVVWLVVQYIVGLRQLGLDVYYVEAHGRTPSMLMEHESDDAAEIAAAYIAHQLHRYGMSGRWAYHDTHTQRYLGLSELQLKKLYAEAEVVINMHGGTVPLAEHAATGRLVYLGTDPVDTELELYRNEQRTVEFLEPHVAFFTWGLNYGNPDCRLPWSQRFPFVPSPPPVLVDMWEHRETAGPDFTTVGNWRQQWREVEFDGELYTWSKHLEFMKVLKLPRRVEQTFDLALSSFDDDDRALLESHGWTVSNASDVSRATEEYKAFIARSRGEFTVAKDQNVRFRTGWFSERSATYLAAGRPVVMQDTGFGNAVPIGAGLLSFHDLDSAAAAIDTINSDYPRHCKAALDIAHEYFDYRVVLGALLDHVGVSVNPSRKRISGVGREMRLPESLMLEPVARRPMTLPAETVEVVVNRPVPLVPRHPGTPDVSVVVVTYNNMLFTRMALESLLENSDEIPYEVIVVDNASTDATREYLSVLSARNGHVKVILNDENRGFAAANNQGLRIARGKYFVLLNNDTIVPRGWWRELFAALAAPGVGLVGPVTNRICNEAEIATSYRTYGEMLAFAEARARDAGGRVFPIRVLAMFCVAMTRETYDRVGPLDERFGIGTLEDDDYSERVRAAGLDVLCCEGAFVHHFSQATFSQLIVSGEYQELQRTNRELFEEKWGRSWVPYQKRQSPAYRSLVQSVRSIVESQTPRGSTVLVVSKGDDALVSFDGRTGLHFPGAGRDYAGFYPSDDDDAVSQLQEHLTRGVAAVVFPSTAAWWLDYYRGLRKHLDDVSTSRLATSDCDVFLLPERPAP